MLATLLIILIAGFVLERVLNFLNSKTWSSELPDELKQYYDEEKYELSQQYEKARDRLSNISSTFNLLVMIAMLISGGFTYLLDWAMNITTDEINYSLIFFGVLFIAGDLLNLPFQLYSTFTIEEKFGFNRTTVKTFIIDKIKGYVLTAFLGGSLLAMFIMFYRFAGTYFWVYAWMAFAFFTLIMAMFYTSWLLPLFNKLKPLEDGELREAITKYSKEVDFPVSEILVMDGSKRSAKANAFFSGLGKVKRIVLFDTLIEQHSIEELVAVLAHEVGHYKLKHTRKNILLSFLQSGLMLFIFSLFINQPELAQALGGEGASFQLGLIAFSILYTPISMIAGLLMNMLSRKYEFEADAYAGKTFNAENLCNALKRLSIKHLSNLQPHPLYVFFYYSHPPLLERLGALRKSS